MEHALHFENPVEGARGIRIFFVISRTSVTAWEVCGLPGVARVRIKKSRHGLDVHWDRPLPRGSSLLLTLEFRGEPRAVAKVVWFDADGAVPLWATRSTPVPAFDAAADFTSDPDQRARAMFMARAAIIQAHPDPIFRSTAGFFLELDLNTNGALLGQAHLSDAEQARRRGAITPLEVNLSERVRSRGRWRALGNLGPAEGLKPLRAGAVEYISGLLLRLYRKHLSKDGTLNSDAVWTVFAKFANGEVRIEGAGEKDWNSEPNGAMVFCFAEFAFSAIDMIEAMTTIDAAHRADLDDWKAILPSHVAIQRIYMTAYRPPSGKLTWGAYTIENWSKDNVVDDDFKTDLRTELEGKSVAELKIAAGQNAFDAFRDQWET